MIYAVYRRAAPDLDWSLACTCDQKAPADALKKREEQRLAAHGYDQAAVKVEKYESYTDVRKTL